MICSKSAGSHFFKIDLAFLEAMKDDLATNNAVDGFASLEGMIVTPAL